MYGLFNTSGKMLWLSVDHRRLRPVDDMVLLGCVVGESGFVVFLPADKGRATVVLDKAEYEEKVLRMLSDANHTNNLKTTQR